MLLVGVLAVGTICALVHFELIDIPVISDTLNVVEDEIHPADVEKDIPDTDMDGIIYYKSSETNIVTEDGGHLHQ